MPSAASHYFFYSLFFFAMPWALATAFSCERLHGLLGYRTCLWCIGLENREWFEEDLYVWSVFQRYGLILICHCCGGMEVVRKKKLLCFPASGWSVLQQRQVVKFQFRKKFSHQLVPFNKFAVVQRPLLLSSCGALQLQLQVFCIWVLITSKAWHSYS